MISATNAYTPRRPLAISPAYSTLRPAPGWQPVAQPPSSLPSAGGLTGNTAPDVAAYPVNLSGSALTSPPGSPSISEAFSERVTPSLKPNLSADALSAQSTLEQSATEPRQRLHLSKKNALHAGLALGLFGLGLATHQIPKPGQIKSWLPKAEQKAIQFPTYLISTNPVEWARIGLGVMAVNQANKAMDVHPPGWLSAVENVAVMTPMMGGKLIDFFLVTPLVMATVSLNNAISEKIFHHGKDPVATSQTAEDNRLPHAHTHGDHPVAEGIARMALSVGMAVGSVFAFPFVKRQAAREMMALGNLLSKESGVGKALFQEGRAMVDEMNHDISHMGLAAATCARGCCSSVVCMTELGENIGAIWTSTKTKLFGGSPSDDQKPSLPSPNHLTASSRGFSA
jgi:hypothetical protein